MQNWAPRIAQGWRIDSDIKPYWSSIAAVLHLASRMYLATGFYQHGDLDMLEVGNNGRGNPSGNLTYAEQKSHFTAWAFMKSHLLIGTDLRNATNSTIEILTNKEIIEINQDPNEGQAIAPFRTGIQPDNSVITYNATYPPPYWAGNSTKGPIFMILNTLDETQTMGFNLTENCTLIVYLFTCQIYAYKFSRGYSCRPPVHSTGYVGAPRCRYRNPELDCHSWCS